MDFADIQSKRLELIHWFSSESEKESIGKGISDADAGKLKPHTEARKLYEKWL